MDGRQKNYCDAPQQQRWWVVSVNSRTEIETARRISEAGFIAQCPTWVKKSGHHFGGRHSIKTKIEVLFPCYLFVAVDPKFNKDVFESSKTRLTVHRKRTLTDETMTFINSTANGLTMAQTKVTHSLTIKRGDLMQILHWALQGEPVEVLKAKRNQILVAFKDKPGYRPIWIDAAQLGRAN